MTNDVNILYLLDTEFKLLYIVVSNTHLVI